MSAQPQLTEALRRSEPDLVERIAAALPEEVRADYYREVSHCRALPESDEMLRILRAMQFLALLMQQAPGQVAAEREKLEQALVGALGTMQAMHRSSLAYHQRLEARLKDLPEEIVGGVDSSAIAYRLADVLHQRFAESGIPRSAQALAAAAQQINRVTGEFQNSAKRLVDSEARVVEGARQALDRMQSGIEASACAATLAAQNLTNSFISGYRWSVFALCSTALVTGFMLGLLSRLWMTSPP